VETSYGHGAVSNDYTNVYAHYSNGKTEDRELVLNGPYLEKTTVRWNAPNDVDLCIGKGRTVEFWNWVTLAPEGLSPLEIHNHLNEGC
jgi:hypothetical protein